MRRNSQHLNDTSNLAVDKVEAEDTESDAPDRRLLDDLVAVRTFQSEGQGGVVFGMVAPAQSSLLLLVIGDLPLMLRRRLWMKAIGHLKSS